MGVSSDRDDLSRSVSEGGDPTAGEGDAKRDEAEGGTASEGDGDAEGDNEGAVGAEKRS